MKVFNKELLEKFVQKHADSINPLNKWVDDVQSATLASHYDLKKIFPSADYVGNSRYVFNIKGNRYRLVSVVLFVGGVMTIRYIGTHADYDKIKDCSTL